MFAGIDLGGTKIAVAVVDTASGRVLARAQGPTDSQAGPQSVLGRMADLVRVACADGAIPLPSLDGIGLGVPGVFDSRTGHTQFLPNLQGAWRDVPAGPGLAAKLGRPVWLINDARAFVLAEATLGAGRGHATVVGLTLGTGVGGGIALAGRLFLGIDGTAGEFGHMTLAPDGPACTCGNRGCLETYASGKAIQALATQQLASGQPSRLLDLAGGSSDRVTPELVGAAAREGDEVALAVLQRVTTYLGVGVANIVTTVSPDCVVLGGSVANLGELLLEPIRVAVRERCRATPVERIRIVQSLLGADAGALGAAIWAAQHAGH